VEIARHREEAFGAEEPAGGDFGHPRRAQSLGEPTPHCLDGAGMVDRPVALAAACVVIAGQRRDALEECGLAGAVLTDDYRYCFVEGDGELVPQKWQAERISRPVLHPFRIQPQTSEVGRREIDDAIST